MSSKNPKSADSPGNIRWCMVAQLIGRIRRQWANSAAMGEFGGNKKGS
jgi:hypothetical protein